MFYNLKVILKMNIGIKYMVFSKFCCDIENIFCWFKDKDYIVL